MTKNKNLLRQEIRQQITCLPEDYLKAADEQILRHIINLPEYQHADTIFCFVGTDSEIHTVPIFKDAWRNGKQVCVPKCVGKGMMIACRISQMGDLEQGHYGILEPSEPTDMVLSEQIDLVLAPCLSCSSDGRRLGYGGGYYDRYLKRVTAPVAVLCRKRVMRDDIPQEVHDIRMDMVICEDGVMRHQVNACGSWK